MNLDNLILINKYGQGLIHANRLINLFSPLPLKMRKDSILNLIHLIVQSDVSDIDIMPAIEESKLRTTFTPCVILKKGVASHNLHIIANLPENELEKVYRLFLGLFKVGYKRKFQKEKNNPNKWWFWDFSDTKKLESVKKYI